MKTKQDLIKELEVLINQKDNLTDAIIDFVINNSCNENNYSNSKVYVFDLIGVLIDKFNISKYELFVE